MLSKEDKKDVKGSMGKALANKVAKVTKDKENPFAKKYKEKLRNSKTMALSAKC